MAKIFKNTYIISYMLSIFTSWSILLHKMAISSAYKIILRRCLPLKPGILHCSLVEQWYSGILYEYSSPVLGNFWSTSCSAHRKTKSIYTLNNTGDSRPASCKGLKKNLIIKKDLVNVINFNYLDILYFTIILVKFFHNLSF